VPSDTAAQEAVRQHSWINKTTRWLLQPGELVDPVQLGVHRAMKIDVSEADSPDLTESVPTYIPRDIDVELDAAISRGGLVLVVGDSASGKTRAAYEAMRRLHRNMSVLVPHSPESLRELASDGVELADTVLWLDDFERYLRPDGIDVALLHSLIGAGTQHVVVLATMRASEYFALSAGHEQDPGGRPQLLQQAKTLYVERNFSESEYKRAAELTRDPRIANALADLKDYGSTVLTSQAETNRPVIPEVEWSVHGGARVIGLVPKLGSSGKYHVNLVADKRRVIATSAAYWTKQPAAYGTESAAREGQGKGKAAVGRDANIAGRDQVIINLEAAGSGDLTTLGLLPRDVPGFTGREGELDRLAGLLAGRSVRPVMVVISGTAGVGKTALAVHAAHWLLPRFPDGVLYADLRGYTEGQEPAEPVEALEVFLRHLGVPAEDVPAGAQERSRLLRQLLASRRVLMVLDNARTEAQVRPLLPAAGGSLVLITSRSVLPSLEADERINLNILSEGEAAAMLAGLIGRDRAAVEPEAVAQLAALCAGLPLALRIVGQLLTAHPVWPVARLTQLLADEQNRLGRLGAGDLQVQAAIDVSYGQLTDGDARLFRLLGLHPGPDFDTLAAASLAGIEADAARPVLDRLVEAHLVIEDDKGRFGMHDLMRLYARSICQEADSRADRDAAEARLVRHYVDLARFLDAYLDPRQHPAEEAEESFLSSREVLSTFETERRNLLAVLDLSVQQGWDQEVWQLSESMGDSLSLLGYLDDLLTVRESTLTAARRAGDTVAAGRALANLGNAYVELRRFEEAITCYQQSLAIRRETGDRYGEGQTLNNLGNAYLELRRFEEAITCYQQSLAIRRETGDRYGEGQTLNNLGDTYQGLQQPDRAAMCWREAAAALRDAGDHEEARHLEQLAANA
jgi:tetratricopeptide (TPR) repeat protein